MGKLFVVALLAVVTASVCEAAMLSRPASEYPFPADLAERARHAVDSLRTINVKQLRDCYSDLINETFLNCSDIFEEDETGRGVTDADVEEFCKADCPHLIEQVYIDCEFQVSRYVNQFLEQSCMTGPDHKCLYIWNQYDEGESVPDYYMQCVEEFTGTCLDSCKKAEEWIVKTFGCCYFALEELFDYYEYDYTVLSGTYWEKCGKKEPQLCKF